MTATLINHFLSLFLNYEFRVGHGYKNGNYRLNSVLLVQFLLLVNQSNKSQHHCTSDNCCKNFILCFFSRLSLGVAYVLTHSSKVHNCIYNIVVKEIIIMILLFCLSRNKVKINTVITLLYQAGCYQVIKTTRCLTVDCIKNLL